MAERVGVYTSIAPSHALGDMQQACAKSWIAAGLVHFNLSPDETATPGRIVRVNPSKGYRRPFVYIDDFIATAIDHGQEVAILVNSDIELRDPDGVLSTYIDKAAAGALVIANREDHNGDGIGTRYEYGFDVFIAPVAFLASLPRSLFVMGQTWWDYWLPWRAIKQGVPLALVKEPIFWHHRHPQQHDTKEWERMTEHFTWIEQAMNGQKPYVVTGKVYNEIKAACR